MGFDDLRVRRPPPPPPTTSATAPTAPATTPNRPTSPTSADAFERSQANRFNLTGEANGSVEVTPDSVSVDASVGGQVTGPRGIGVSFEASAHAEVRRDVESEDGFTTYTVSRDMSVTVSGEVDAGVVGFGAGHTEGVQSTYQVRMSDEDYARLEAGEIPEPNPFDPETMPEGSSIVMNSSDYENNEFSASYRQIKLDSNVREEEGASVVIERGEDNQFSVTAGPTEAIENSWQLGVSLGIASAHIGNTTELESFSLNTATFDLDTEEGTGAYNEFLVAGSFPEDNGPGVSDVAKIEKLNYSSTSSIGGSLGPFSGSVELGSSGLNRVTTTLPDGTSTSVTDFRLSGGVPVHLEQAFRADGTEDIDAQRFSMTLTDVDDTIGAYIYTAFTGEEDYDTAKDMFEGDKDLVLTFTAEQAEDLAARAREYTEGYEERSGVPWEDHSMGPGDYFIDLLSKADNAAELADAFGRAHGEGWIAEELLTMTFETSSNIDDGEIEALPGEIEVR